MSGHGFSCIVTNNVIQLPMFPTANLKLKNR